MTALELIQRGVPTTEIIGGPPLYINGQHLLEERVVDGWLVRIDGKQTIPLVDLSTIRVVLTDERTYCVLWDSRT